MSLTDFHVRNYRSIKDVWLKLKKINVIVGPNGTGKSNLYRAMFLVASTANGQLAKSVADEGGVKSLQWAGPHSKLSLRRGTDVMLSVQTSELRYDLKFGRWIKDPYLDSFFKDDLEIKRERLFLVKSGRKTSVLDRRRVEVVVYDAQGKRLEYTKEMMPNESMLTGLRDPHKFTHLFALRQELLDWRFYHQFRTDEHSPLRKPQTAILTPVMSHTGVDFVSALATIAEMGNKAELDVAINDAFPGSIIGFARERERMKLYMNSPDFFRPFELPELSDGTIQYLCLLAALMSPMPPAVLALNEPETSIHPRLLEPLAKLIVRASKQSQIWITTHSQDLSDYILDMTGYEPLELKKVDGETRLVGVGLGGYKEDDDQAEEEEDDDGEPDDNAGDI